MPVPGRAIALLGAGGLAALAGCYVPPLTHPPGAPELRRFEPGVTTRADLIARLGAPDRLDAGGLAAWEWQRSKGSILVPAGDTLVGGEIDVTRYRLLAAFDGQGVLRDLAATSLPVTASRPPGESPPSPPGEDWREFPPCGVEPGGRHLAPCLAVTFSPTGGLLAAVCEAFTAGAVHTSRRRTLCVREAGSGAELEAFPGDEIGGSAWWGSGDLGPAAVAFAAGDEQLAVVSGETSVVWERATRRQRARLAGPGPPRQRAAVAAFSGDGRLALIGGSKGGVRLLDVTAATELGSFRAARRGISSLAMDATGRAAAIADERHLVRLVDARTGADLVPPLSLPWAPAGRIVALSPDGHQLAASDCRLLTLWRHDGSTAPLRLRAAALVPYPATELPGCHDVLAFSDDGQVLAAATPGALRLYDLRRLLAPESPDHAGIARDIAAYSLDEIIHGLAWSSGEPRRLALASDRGVRVLDVPR